MLGFIQIIQLIGFACLMSAGQILFKQTAAAAPPLTNVAAVFSLIGNFWFWLAIALYGGATLLWIVILQKIPLSAAYPFAALAFVIVPVAAWVFYGETISLRYAGGVVLILLGVLIVSLSAQDLRP